MGTIALAQPGFLLAPTTGRQSPFDTLVSLLTREQPRPGYLVQPNATEVARFGAGTLILPPGVESGYVDADPEHATLLGPDGSVLLCAASEVAVGPAAILSSAPSEPVADAARLRSGTAIPLPTGQSPKKGLLGKTAFTNLAVQGLPIGFGVWGDVAKANAVGLNMLASGTFRTDPLGTQDPDSLMSLPLQWLTGDYWGKTITPELRRSMDVDSAQDSVQNTWSKSIRYLVGIAASMEAISKVEERGSKDPEKRRLLVMFDYYAALSNAGFLGEKLLAIPCLLAIALAQSCGESSPWWDVGYVSSALFVNAGLVFSNLAWYAKLRSGAHLLQLEQSGYAKAQREGREFDLNGAHVASFTFDVANAIPRVAKHMVAHVSTLALILWMYAPEKLSWLGDFDYMKDAATRMGDHVSPEQIYRWANFGFAVPVLQTIIGTLIASYAALGNGRGAITKLGLDQAKLHALESRSDHELFVTGDKPQTVGERRAQLRREIIADRFSIGGALGLVGVGLTVAYPALEHIDLVCAAVFGGGTFGAYCAREWPAIAALTSRAIAYVERKAKRAAKRALRALTLAPDIAPELKAVEPTLITPKMTLKERAEKLWHDFKQARAMVRAYNEESLAPLRALPWHRRMGARWQQLRQAQRDWGTFVRAYYRRDQKPSVVNRVLARLRPHR